MRAVTFREKFEQKRQKLPQQRAPIRGACVWSVCGARLIFMTGSSVSAVKHCWICSRFRNAVGLRGHLGVCRGQ